MQKWFTFMNRFYEPIKNRFTNIVLILKVFTNWKLFISLIWHQTQIKPTVSLLAIAFVASSCGIGIANPFDFSNDSMERICEGGTSAIFWLALTEQKQHMLGDLTSSAPSQKCHIRNHVKTCWCKCTRNCAAWTFPSNDSTSNRHGKKIWFT